MNAKNNETDAINPTAVIVGCFIVLIVIAAMFGPKDTTDYSTPSNSNYSNLSELPDDVEEDMLIYGILKSQGYSDEDSVDAVINTMNKSSF